MLITLLHQILLFSLPLIITLIESYNLIISKLIAIGRAIGGGVVLLGIYLTPQSYLGSTIRGRVRIELKRKNWKGRLLNQFLNFDVRTT